MYLELESVGGLIGGATNAQKDFAVIHSFWIPQLAGQAGRGPRTGRTTS